MAAAGTAIEVALRPDRAWLPIVVAVSLVIALALLRRRTHPLAAVAVTSSGAGGKALGLPNTPTRWSTTAEVMAERFVGVEQARGQLGRLVDDVAGGSDAISLTKRGRPVAMLVSRDEWEALRGMVRAEAREELARRLAQVRENVADAGLDPATVDEAIEAARKVS